MRIPRNLNLLLEASCILLVILSGLFVVANRVFEMVDVPQASNVVTFVVVLAIASWIWTRPISR